MPSFSNRCRFSAASASLSAASSASSRCRRFRRSSARRLRSTRNEAELPSARRPFLPSSSSRHGRPSCHWHLPRERKSHRIKSQIHAKILPASHEISTYPVAAGGRRHRSGSSSLSSAPASSVRTARARSRVAATARSTSFSASRCRSLQPQHTPKRVRPRRAKQLSSCSRDRRRRRSQSSTRSLVTICARLYWTCKMYTRQQTQMARHTEQDGGAALAAGPQNIGDQTASLSRLAVVAPGHWLILGDAKHSTRSFRSYNTTHRPHEHLSQRSRRKWPGIDQSLCFPRTKEKRGQGQHEKVLTWSAELQVRQQARSDMQPAGVCGGASARLTQRWALPAGLPTRQENLLLPCCG